MKQFKKEDTVFFIPSTYGTLENLKIITGIIVKNNGLRNCTYNISYLNEGTSYIHEVSDSNIFINKEDAIKYLQSLLEERLSRSLHNRKRAEEDVIRYTKENEAIALRIKSLTVE